MLPDSELLRIYSSAPTPAEARRALFDAGLHYVPIPEYALFTWGHLHNHNGSLCRYVRAALDLDGNAANLGVVSQADPTSPWLWSLFPTPKHKGYEGSAPREEGACAALENAIRASGLVMLEWVQRDNSTLLVTPSPSAIKVARITYSGGQHRVQILNENAPSSFSTPKGLDHAKAMVGTLLRKAGIL